MDAFLVKKTISHLVSVVPIIILLVVISQVISRRFPNVSKCILAVTFIACLALSSPAVSNVLAHLLEKQPPAMGSPPADTRFIAVLSGAKGQRLIEAIRLFRLSDGVTFITTIGTAQSSGPEQYQNDFTSYYALGLGINEQQLIRIPDVADTEDELQKIAAIVEDNTVLIVSSAIHLPRVAMLAEQFDINAVFAPADTIKSRSAWWKLSSGSLSSVDKILHEFLGMAWYSLKNIF